MDLLIYDEYYGEHREVGVDGRINLSGIISPEGDSYDIYVRIGSVEIDKREDDNGDYIATSAAFTPSPAPAHHIYPTFDHLRNDLAAQIQAISTTFANNANTNHQFDDDMEIDLTPQDDIEVQFGVDISGTAGQMDDDDTIEIEFHRPDQAILSGSSAYANPQPPAEPTVKRRNHL